MKPIKFHGQPLPESVTVRPKVKPEVIQARAARAASEFPRRTIVVDHPQGERVACVNPSCSVRRLKPVRGKDEATGKRIVKYVAAKVRARVTKRTHGFRGGAPFDERTCTSCGHVSPA